MTVAITGATGVVGGAVLRHLIDAGHEVRALARTDRAAATLTGTGATPVRGDVNDLTALSAAFSGCDVVYHVAGINEMCSSDPARMYRVNVDGTRTVLGACEAAGVRRMVLTSSAVTIGEEAGEVATEDVVHRGHHISNYEQSKHHAELVAFAQKTDVEVVAVNPSSVQGPGRATGTGRIILQVLQGKLPFLVDTTVTLVDIDDCARGHLLAAQRGVPGERYMLSGFITTTAEAVEMASEVLGRVVSVRMLPIPLVMGVVGLAYGGARLVGKRLSFCPEMVRVMAHGHRHDGSKATRELGLEYTPPEETIRRMVEWFQAQDLL